MKKAVTVYSAARPVRAVVLVPQIADVPWEFPFIAALRSQSLVWGGSGNLPVPVIDGLAEHPVYRAISRMMDPDAVLIADVAWADLEDLLPDRFAAQRDALRSNLEGQRFNESSISDFMDRALAEPLSPTRFDRSAAAPLLAGHAFLNHDGHVEQSRCGAGRSPGHPFVDVLKLASRHRVKRIVQVRASDSASAQLALAAHGGQLNPRDHSRLAEANVTHESREVASGDWALARELFAIERRPDHRPFSLSESGLAWYGSPTYRPVVPIIVGSDPWDFCLFYALRRYRTVAFWLPEAFVDDPAWLYEIRNLPLRLQLGDDAVLTFASVSDPALAGQAAAAVAASVGDRSATQADWEKLVPSRPNQLLVRDSGSTPTTLGVDDDGLTSHLSSPPPSVRTERDPFDMYWMTDATIDGWSSLDSSLLAPHLVSARFGGSGLVRPSKSGVSYLAPGPFVAAGMSLESQTMPVRLRPLGLLEQLRALLQERGWDAQLSDKGVYATESASIFGDIAELANVAGDENWRALFSLLTDRKNRPPGHFSRGDQRRYFALDEVAAAIEESRLTLTPRDLISMGVIWRGLRSRCPRCRWESWYPQDELAAKVRCSRCRLEVSARDAHWVGEAEPAWWYRIHEVLWQFFTTHADVALNASFKFLTSERSPAIVLPAIELLDRHGRAAIEIDLAVLWRRRLWLGEAKTTSSLGSATEGRAQLNKLHRAVKLLGADGVLMVSGAPSGFSTDTRTLIHERLDDLGVELVIEAI